MKHVNFIFILIIALIMAACGSQDSPEIAAKEWTDALLNLEGNKLAERTCVAQQANVQGTAIWASAFAILGQQLIDQQTKADISDLRFHMNGATGKEARVEVSGEVRFAVLAVAQSTPVNTTFLMVQENGKWKWCGEEGWPTMEATSPPVGGPVGQRDIIPL